MTLLEKYLVIDRLLSPWSSLGLWLWKMGNNPTRHQKRKEEFTQPQWFCTFICSDWCFAGETVLSEMCTIAFLIQTDPLLWCFWFWRPAFRVTQAVWCRTWRVRNAGRIFPKEVGVRVRREDLSAIWSSYRFQADADHWCHSAHSAWPVPRSNRQRNQPRQQIKWNNWLGNSACLPSLNTSWWEVLGWGQNVGRKKS